MNPTFAILLEISMLSPIRCYPFSALFIHLFCSICSMRFAAHFMVVLYTPWMMEICMPYLYLGIRLSGVFSNFLLELTLPFYLVLSKNLMSPKKFQANFYPLLFILSILQIPYFGKSLDTLTIKMPLFLAATFVPPWIFVMLLSIILVSMITIIYWCWNAGLCYMMMTMYRLSFASYLAFVIPVILTTLYFRVFWIISAVVDLFSFASCSILYVSTIQIKLN